MPGDRRRWQNAVAHSPTQDDQMNCLIILIIFMKQRTYLITLPNPFTGVINGLNQQFQLSALPDPVTSLVFTVNGVVQVGYSLYQPTATVTLAVAPRPGDVLSAIYQITTIA